MSMPIQEGARIRLVVLEVEMNDGTTTNASLRFAWPEGDPEHSCNADMCVSCVDTAKKKAIDKRRSGTGNMLAATGSVRLLRDGQSRSF